MFKSKLHELLDSNKFNDAKLLLKSELKEAKIINPSDYDLTAWPQYADLISSKILSVEGEDASNDFWEGLLEFFKKELEPTWGHLHKGHILFRLGIGKLYADVSCGKKLIEKALEECRILERNLANGKAVDIEDAIKKYSSYVMLCIIETVEDQDFTNNAEKQTFFRQLVSLSLVTIP